MGRPAKTSSEIVILKIGLREEGDYGVGRGDDGEGLEGRETEVESVNKQTKQTNKTRKVREFNEIKNILAIKTTLGI